MRGRIDVVHEPRLGSDRGPDPERSILSPDEDFKVIVDDGFGQGGKVSSASRMEEDGVSSQAFGHPGD